MVYDDYARELIAGCEAFIEKFGNDGTPPPVRPSSSSAYQQILYGLRLCVYVVRHCVTGGGGGTLDHSLLNNRDIAAQHPIAAITGLGSIIAGLDSALDARLEKNQGAANAGKWLAIDGTGEIVFVPSPGTVEFAGPYASMGDLPDPGEGNVLYLVGAAAPYQIYAWINGGYVLTGSTSIDLEDYYTKEEVDAAKLAKLTDGTDLFAYTHHGESQGEVAVSNAPAPSAIARYKADGNLAVSDATDGADAVNLNVLAAMISTLDAEIQAAVKKSGDTMTGALILRGAPEQDLEAATKKYVDDNSGGGGGGTMDHSQLTNRNIADQHPIAAITGLDTQITEFAADIADLAAAIATVAANALNHAGLTNRNIANQHPTSAISGLDQIIAELETAIAELAAAIAGGGGYGTFDHTQLINRDWNDQHPTTAITGLNAILTNLDGILAGLQNSINGLQNYIVELYNYDVELYNYITELSSGLTTDGFFGYDWVGLPADGWQPGDLLACDPVNSATSEWFMGFSDPVTVSLSPEGGLFGYMVEEGSYYGFGLFSLETVVVLASGHINPLPFVNVLAKFMTMDTMDSMGIHKMTIPVCALDLSKIVSDIPQGNKYTFTGYALDQVNAGNKRWGVWRPRQAPFTRSAPAAIMSGTPESPYQRLLENEKILKERLDSYKKLLNDISKIKGKEK